MALTRFFVIENCYRYCLPAQVLAVTSTLSVDRIWLAHRFACRLNNSHFLSRYALQAHSVAVLQEGSVAEYGTYVELMAKTDGLLASLMQGGKGQVV